MELVDVKDLEIGDEIVISSGSSFRYLRVMRQPRIGKKVHWHTKLPLYTALKCSTRIDVIKHSRTWGTPNKVHTWEEKKYIFTPEDHNAEISVNLNCRNILLIKKANV